MRVVAQRDERVGVGVGEVLALDEVLLFPEVLGEELFEFECKRKRE